MRKKSSRSPTLRMSLKQQTRAPADYPSRATIGVDSFNWTDQYYTPNEYDARVLQTSPLPCWADNPACSAEEVSRRLTYAGDDAVPKMVGEVCAFDVDRMRYLNPMGKTGIRGRGVLGKFGPNHAADCLVTRINPVSKKPQAVVIDRVGGDGTTLAWPAGMVEPGDDVPKTLKKEFEEEAADAGHAVEKLFNECRYGVVYRGWVDDHRNTDDAWVETTAVLFHATPDIAADLRLGILDTHEVRRVVWKDLESISEMYASHFEWLCKVRDEIMPILMKNEAGGRLISLSRSNPDAVSLTAAADDIETGLSFKKSRTLL